jgi:hypothetical protein
MPRSHPTNTPGRGEFRDALLGVAFHHPGDCAERDASGCRSCSPEKLLLRLIVRANPARAESSFRSGVRTTSGVVGDGGSTVRLRPAAERRDALPQPERDMRRRTTRTRTRPPSTPIPEVLDAAPRVDGEIARGEESC